MLPVCVCVSPQVRASVHQVKDLCRVQQLLEAPQELHALIVSTFRVDEHQQWTGAGRRTGRLPETWTHTHTHKETHTSHVRPDTQVFQQRGAKPLTVRVDAVERRRRDDRHFALTQRTLGRQLLLTGRVHLEAEHT